MEDKNYKSRIESLKKRLYSKNGIKFSPSNAPLHKKQYDIPTAWDDKKKEHNVSDKKKSFMGGVKKRKSLLNILLLASFVFFVGAVLFAYISLKDESSYVSSENIEVSVSGPLSIGAGEVLSLEVTVLNRNSIRLETTDLLIEYPEGTRSADDVNKELKRDRKSLSIIDTGKSKQTIIESILFGEEGDKKTISLGIEYRIPGSNAIFSTERTYEIEINSSPVLLSVEAPVESNSGQEIDLTLEISSNSSSVVEDVLVVVTYPFGFTPTQQQPNSDFENRIWRLGDLPVGSKRTVKISGIMEGQKDEERIFRFEIGVESQSDEKEIGIAFLSRQETVILRRPFIGIDLVLDGSRAEENSSPSGSVVRGDFSWQNNTSSKITDAVIEIKLEGDILDKASVSPSKGFYRSSDSTILWESRTLGSLEVIRAGEKGTVSFGFSSLGLSVAAGKFKNADIVLSARMRGQRIEDNGSQNSVLSEISKIIHITTNLNISARALYFSGPFINNGPIPPKADKETTYTIVWSLSNSLNDVNNVSVKATLPSYVRWMGVVNPQSEKIKYNSVGGGITWEVGNLKAGAGYTSPVREISFQIALTPSISQIGLSPVITKSITTSGTDAFSGAEVSSSWGSLSTQLNTDPQFKSKDGVVVP